MHVTELGCNEHISVKRASSLKVADIRLPYIPVIYTQKCKSKPSRPRSRSGSRRGMGVGSWFRGFSRFPLKLKFHFHRKCLMINFGYCIYNFCNLFLYIVPIKFTSPCYYLWMCLNLLDEWKTVKTLVRRRVLWHLIWVYTICLDFSLQILRVSTVVWSNRTPLRILTATTLLLKNPWPDTRDRAAKWADWSRSSMFSIHGM